MCFLLAIQLNKETNNSLFHGHYTQNLHKNMVGDVFVPKSEMNISEPVWQAETELWLSVFVPNKRKQMLGCYLLCPLL